MVVSGIAECPRGTSHLNRLDSDINNVASVFDRLQCRVSVNVIRDCRRRGRYSPQKDRPRPLLVTLNSTKDVASILSRRGSTPSPYIIKPFLSIKEKG